MRFCDAHWDRLRTKIEERGLAHLIAPSAVIAADQFSDQVAKEDLTPANFDPLMNAHWAILNNVLDLLGPSGLYIMAGGDEDPIDFDQYSHGPATRTRLKRDGVEPNWPRCPLCYIGIAHELTCTERRCSLAKIDGYAWMMDRAADDALARAEKLGMLKTGGEG